MTRSLRIRAALCGGCDGTIGIGRKLIDSAFQHDTNRLECPEGVRHHLDIGWPRVERQRGSTEHQRDANVQMVPDPFWTFERVRLRAVREQMSRWCLTPSGHWGWVASAWPPGRP